MKKLLFPLPVVKLPIFTLITIFCLVLVITTACQTIPSENSDSLQYVEITSVSPTASSLTAAGTTPNIETTPSHETVTPIIKPSPTPYPENFWMELPVIPTTVSDRVREVYQKGLEMGKDPHTFSRIGDCNSRAPDFLAGFGGYYNLGEYNYLQPTVDYFKDSFRLVSQAANPGVTTYRLLVSLWTNELCLANESLLDCQYRLDQGSFAFIGIGTIDAKTSQDRGAYERNMRLIIEETMAQGIVPILITKADNIEGDNSINATMGRLALEYEIPLINFWRAAQPLVNHGLNPDLEHLNFWSAPPSTDFSLPIAFDYGKEVRNLTALQTLTFLKDELITP